MWNTWKTFVKWVCGYGWGNPLIAEEVAENIEDYKLPDPEPIIGEPVISFINLVKSNPKRFTVKEGFVDGWFRVNLTDTITDEVFWCEGRPVWTLAGYSSSVCTTMYEGSPSFLTQDEWKYVDNELYALKKDLEERQERAKKYKEQKAKKKERQRLIDVYCIK